MYPSTTRTTSSLAPGRSPSSSAPRPRQHSTSPTNTTSMASSTSRSSIDRRGSRCWTTRCRSWNGWAPALTSLSCMTGWPPPWRRADFTHDSGELGREPGSAGFVEEVPGGADDGRRVDPEGAVEVVDVAGAAEVAHAEAGGALAVDAGEEAQCVRMPVEDRDDRCGPVGGEEPVEDGVVAGPEAAPGLEGAVGEVGRRQADDVRAHADRRQLIS